ncbi:MAG: hypothetical protein ACK4KW_11215 [Gemmobacter sp.]
MTRSLTLALAGALIGLPAAAQDPAAFTYPDFEAAVPHIDMDACPDGMAEGDVFCRITMNNDALHIFVFELGGDQRFVAVHSFHEDEFEIVLKR